MRKNRRALDRPDAVNDVDAVDDRDLQAARQRALPEGVGHVGPARRRVVLGRRSALAEEQTNSVLPELRRRYLEPLELHDLRELLVERHLRDQAVRHVDAGLGRERPGQRRASAASADAARAGLPAGAAHRHHAAGASHRVVARLAAGDGRRARGGQQQPSDGGQRFHGGSSVRHGQEIGAVEAIHVGSMSALAAISVPSCAVWPVVVTESLAVVPVPSSNFQ